MLDRRAGENVGREIAELVMTHRPPPQHACASSRGARRGSTAAWGRDDPGGCKAVGAGRRRKRPGSGLGRRQANYPSPPRGRQVESSCCSKVRMTACNSNVILSPHERATDGSPGCPAAGPVAGRHRRTDHEWPGGRVDVVEPASLSSDTQFAAVRRHPDCRTPPPVNCPSDCDFASHLPW